jgi:2-dehydropantoate 2-reductase
MRHAVLGAGGVGGLVGGALAKAGHPVTQLVRPGRRDHYPEQLSVESETFGTFEAPVQVADRLDGQFDVVWITVKATALEAALSAVAPKKLGDGVVVPLLNGVDHVGQLRDRYGAERVLPGTIRVEAERIGPGRVRHLCAFADVQVAPRPAIRARTEALCKELRGVGLGCEVSEDEVTMLWSKLCFLAPFALATTASGGPLGALRSDSGWWTRLEGCVEEACAVGVAQRFPELDAKRRVGGATAGG